MLQLDLFGDAEAEETKAQTRADDRALWESLWERYEVPAPFLCADRTPKGTLVGVVRCIFCGEHEPSGFLLALSHGFDPAVRDWAKLATAAESGWCTSLWLRRGRPRPLSTGGPDSWQTQMPAGPRWSDVERAAVLRGVLVAKFGADAPVGLEVAA